MGQQTAESGTARREANRRLADEGLSVREISERTGHPKSTVHRDLAGYEPDTRASSRKQAAELRREAKRLSELQISERGTHPGVDVEGNPVVIRGPYVKTPERESRAAQIVSLRKQAAHLEHPL